MSANGQVDPIVALLRQYHADELMRARKDVGTASAPSQVVHAAPRPHPRSLSGAWLAAAVIVIVAALAASTMIRPPVVVPTPSPSSTPSPTASPAQSPSPTVPLSVRERAQAIAYQLIETAAASGGTAVAAGYTQVRFDTYWAKMYPSGAGVPSPLPAWSDEILVVEVDGWFPNAHGSYSYPRAQASDSPRGKGGPVAAPASGSATSIVVAYDLALGVQVDALYSLDPGSPDIPGASPGPAHHMATLTTIAGSLRYPLVVALPDGSPERQQVERIVNQIMGETQNGPTRQGSAKGAAYVETTLGAYQASGLAWCGAATPAMLASGCPRPSGSAASAASVGHLTGEPTDRVLVIEVDGGFFAGTYSRPKARPSDDSLPRIPNTNPLLRGYTYTGIVVAYDLTTGAQSQEVVLFGGTSHFWFVEVLGQPTILWDWGS